MTEEYIIKYSRDLKRYLGCCLIQHSVNIALFYSLNPISNHNHHNHNIESLGIEPLVTMRFIGSK